MHRDHAWHSARHLEDLEEAADIGRRAGERAVARLNPGAAQARQISGAVRSARFVNPARPFCRRDQRLGDRAQDQLPSGQARRAGIRARRHHHRRSAAAARPRSRPFDGEGVRVRRQELVSTVCSRAGSPRALRRGSSGLRRPAMPSRGPAARPEQARATSTWRPGRAAARSCWGFPEAVLVIELIGQGVNGVTGDYSRGAVASWSAAARSPNR